jgi:penicillin-binding protein 1C
MNFKRNSTGVWQALTGALCLLVFLLLPPVRFKSETSTVLLDRNGQLLSATVSDKGMWQFPASDTVPYKFATCITQFEDAYFRFHPGVNPFSMARAAYQNIKARKVVSGGSTITMQLVRLSRRGKPRTLGEKILEMAMAVRTEISYSKPRILAMYSSNAPFGGNVVGLDAAAWRYFGVSPQNLSWAEAATLAVLPNAPGLIFPGRNQHLLVEKRNKLLYKLLKRGYIDDETYHLALLELPPNSTGELPHERPTCLPAASTTGLRVNSYGQPLMEHSRKKS